MKKHDPYECGSLYYFEFDPEGRVFCDHVKDGAKEADRLSAFVARKIIAALPAAASMTACDPKVRRLANKFMRECRAELAAEVKAKKKEVQA